MASFSGMGAPPTPARSSGGRANPYNLFVRSRAAQGVPWARAFLHPSGYMPSSGRSMRQAARLPGIPGAPGSPAAPGPAAQAQQPASPLDSTYYSNVANNLFQTTNRVNALNQQSGYANTDLQNALSRLAYQQPRDQLRLEEGANRSGGLYSTGYGQQQSNIGVNYANQQSALNQNFARGQAGRQEEISGLLGGLPLYAAGQYAAAADRASNSAAVNQLLGIPDPSAPGTAAPGGSAPGTAPGGLPRVQPHPLNYANTGFVRNRAAQGVPWARAFLRSRYGR